MTAWWVALAGGLPSHAASASADVSTNAADRAACERQLNFIFAAIEQYRKANEGALPAKLSDLTPDFLHDPEILICPYVRKRGGLRTWKKKFIELSPDSYTSYSYEFPPVPLSFNQWRGLPKLTWQQFKLRQVEAIGNVVPIVRCHDHFPWLNMSFDGPIYESAQLSWELKFLKEEEIQSIGQNFPLPPPAPLHASDFPPRDARADVRELDLSEYYNAELTNGWQGYHGNNLANFPPGLHTFNGIRFDARGVIQVRGTEFPVTFPAEVVGIKVAQKCRRIHFLQAASFLYRDGNTNGLYTMHYADGHEERFALIYGRHIADWWYFPDKPFLPTEAQVAWMGESEAASAFGMSIRLFHTIWENPRPEVEIETISVGSAYKHYSSGAFVVAITLE